MKIQLNSIKASPNPIRKTWDEEKMEELAQSIREQGLIVPIKVRPANEKTQLFASYLEKHGDGWSSVDDRTNALMAIFGEWDDESEVYPDEQWEIVYGHRRVEAARRAGLDEIECIVEGVDDTDALLQAGMENLSKEDMSSYDKGKWSVRIRTMTGWSIRELANISGIGKGLLSDWENYYKEVEQGTAVRQSQQGGEGVRQTIEIKKSLSNPEDKRAVADKVEREGLTWQQTKQVAESVAATQDPAMRERLINAPYSPYTHDPEYARDRAERYGAHDPMARDKSPLSDEAWKLTVEVSMLLDFIKKARQMSQEAIKMDEMGKFSPEARPFIARKLRQLIADYEALIERLEEQNE